MASTRTASTVTHPDGTIAACLVHAAGVTSSALPTVQEPEPEPEESPHHRNLSLSLDQVNELLCTRLPESGGCASLERIALGFNNISYVATSRAADGKQYVIRATKDSWPPEKVRCEMACIRLMRSLTSLPVPTPLCWDASADEFGCRWILMEKMEGRVMDAEEFDALPEPQRAALTSQMVGYLEQLQALRWDSTGSFYPVESEEGQDANDSVLVGRDAVEVGPYFDGLHGPFHSSLEYALGMLRSAIAEAETKPALKPRHSPSSWRRELCSCLRCRLWRFTAISPCGTCLWLAARRERRRMICESLLCSIGSWEAPSQRTASGPTAPSATPAPHHHEAFKRRLSDVA
jgi:hypothetical protein